MPLCCYNGYNALPLETSERPASAREQLRATPVEAARSGIDAGHMSLEEMANDADVNGPVPSPLEPGPAETSAAWSGVDIVQFTCAIFYAMEDEPSLLIDIMRLGSLRGVAKATYRTIDGSAKAGQRFVQTVGTVVFNDGEYTKPVKIPLIFDPSWAATEEFQVTLESPQDCELGLYLFSCRVKVINVNLFPSDKYKEYLSWQTEHPGSNKGSKVPAEAPDVGLFWEFVKLIYGMEGMKWRTLVFLFFDLMRNAYLIMTLNLNIYLINVVLAIKDPDSENHLIGRSREETALFMCILYVCPLWLIHCWEYYKIKYVCVEVMAKEIIQSNLFRSYMNYSARSRREAKGMSIVILKDAPEAAAGYTHLLALVQKVLGIIIMQGFVMMHSTHNARFAVVLMPVPMAIFGLLRVQNIDEATKATGDEVIQNEGLVDEVEDKYELIADYAQRPRLNHDFVERLSSSNKASVREGLIVLNYLMCPEHYCAIITGGWIAWQVPSVIRDQETLGTFLAMLTIFAQVAQDFGHIFKELMELQKRIVSLRDLTQYFNKETDTEELRIVNRKRRALTGTAFEKLLNHPQNAKLQCPTIDTMPLDVRNVTLQYHPAPPLVESVKVSAHQGSLICVAGPHGAGRQTFLHALSYRLFPDNGIFFVPSHLRAIHVSHDPYILDRSAWDNLTFSCPDEDPRRVLEIMEILGLTRVHSVVARDLRALGRLPEDLGHKCQHRRSMLLAAKGVAESEIVEVEDDESMGWVDYLTNSDKSKMHLARAFIANPEVLVLQRPFRQFSEHGEERKSLMDAIRKHIGLRGLGMPAGTVCRRRPRTVIFTAETQGQEQESDVVWRIHDGDDTAPGTMSMSLGMMNSEASMSNEPSRAK